MSTDGFCLQKAATLGNQGQGTMTEAEETMPTSSISAQAEIEAWHIPISSAWRMTTRSSGPKPNDCKLALMLAPCPGFVSPPRGLPKIISQFQFGTHAGISPACAGR